MEAVPTDCVILLHGLARTSLSMTPIAQDLRRLGYLVVNQNYPSRRLPLPELISYVDRALATCEQRAGTRIRVSFVTHSMGGILLRQFFKDRPEALTRYQFHRAVMLGPPNQGSEIVDRWGDWWAFKAVNGPAGQALSTRADGVITLPRLPLPVGIIAGDSQSQNWLLPDLPRPHDGKVSVASTHLPEEMAHVVVPVGHTFLMRSKQVRIQVALFLQKGIFSAQ